MNSPIVSVIITSYNREKLLPYAIESAISQTFKDLEIIVVDDGSEDNTKQIVDEFIKKDKRIIYLRHKENQGGNKARNTGIRNSKGKYISFLDSDDIWLPEKIEKEIEVFDKSNLKNLGLVYCGVLSIKEDKEISISLPKDRGNVFYLLLSYNFIKSGSSAMIKRLCFEKCGFFDQSEELRIGGSQEYEMWIRIAKDYSFDFTEDVLCKYYIHKESITYRRSIKEKINAELYIFYKYKDYYSKSLIFYSRKMRYAGEKYILLKNKKTARAYFLKSIIAYPFNYKSYIYLLSSFLKKSYI